MAKSHYQTIAPKYDGAIVRGMNKRERKETIAAKHRRALQYWKDKLELTTLGWCTKAGISEGTLRNFLSGKAATIEADTLESLALAIGKNMGELLDPEAGQSPALNESIYALEYAVKTIIQLLLDKKRIDRQDLRSDLIYALDFYQKEDLPGAIRLIEDLLAGVEGQTSQKRPPEVRRILQLAPRR